MKRCKHCEHEVVETIDGECTHAVVSCVLIGVRRENATDEDELVADAVAAWSNRNDPPSTKAVTS